ncbi:hypothetical protein KC19_12G053400 [Ceratodon purpureus]|uniref:Uncharacterized protein n=1 Tax=Ceratodon purpureus TaxID=3225 RepID=A0A8T0G7X3_CERPU|nr:hypothetical protein KC19_12G053400 [Ceratodon purpureus]
MLIQLAQFSSFTLKPTRHGSAITLTSITSLEDEPFPPQSHHRTQIPTREPRTNDHL